MSARVRTAIAGLLLSVGALFAASTKRRARTHGPTPPPQGPAPAPVAPVEPVEPVAPVERAARVGPVERAARVGPVEPVARVEPVERIAPVEPEVQAAPAAVTVPPDPSPPPPRKPVRARSATGRRLGTMLIGFLLVVGTLAIAETVVTLVWQEPFSAFTAGRVQNRLRDSYDRLLQAQAPAARSPLERARDREIDRIRNSRRRVVARMDLIARRMGRETPEGQPIGRLTIPRIGADFIVRQGTAGSVLRGGPGRYRSTQMPGEPGTVGIAGHRTTYSAPFRKIDDLRKGDPIRLNTPYGRFTYEVEETRIVKPGNVDSFRYVGYERLVLTACHPLYSAAQRIIVFARLDDRRPGGWALDAERKRARRAALRERVRERQQRAQQRRQRQ